MGGPTPAAIAAWEEAAMAAKPGYLATNVEDGVYDIGILSRGHHDPFLSPFARDLGRSFD